MKEELNIKILDKNSKWWKNEKNITWAVKSGEDWWLVKNEQAVPNTNKKISKPVENNHNNLRFYINCFLASTLGACVAIGVCVVLSWLL